MAVNYVYRGIVKCVICQKEFLTDDRPCGNRHDICSNDCQVEFDRRRKKAKALKRSRGDNSEEVV